MKAALASPRPLVAVAMSGGVDSAVAAALLLERGYRVLGVTLRLWDADRKGDRICSDHRDASRVAAALGIEHHLLDRRSEFDRRVVTPFVDAYAAGRTPNPCAACNSQFKLGALLEWALARGAEAVGTGHYARLRRAPGGVGLLRGADERRDQSYFLFELSQAQLERTLFPIGDLTKEEVRAKARVLRLPVAEKPGSQDLCFGDPAALVARRSPAAGREGEIVAENGRVMGRHSGVESFTIGQRRGLGVAAGKPLYVRAIDAAGSRVTVGPAPPAASALVARDWRGVGEAADGDESLLARLRHRHPGTVARVREVETGRAELRFDRPAVAVTPGQAVVVYREEEVVGGGWIERACEARVPA